MSLAASTTNDARAAQADPRERWRPERPRRASAPMPAILAGSLLVHGLLVVAAMLARPADIVRPEEIPIDVVQEVPEPKSELAKTEMHKPTKPEPAKPEPALHEPAMHEPAESRAPEPRPAKAAPPSPPRPSADETRRADLERELAQLRAEQAALASDDKGLGPLRQSMQAIALPELSRDGEGDAVGYQAIVFSQLARAKGEDGRMGRPGTAGVRFMGDDKGAIVRLELAVTSGIASLDAEALAIVRRAAPFPPPPADAQRTFSANFSFVARSAR